MQDAGTDLTTIVDITDFVTSLLDVDFDPVGFGVSYTGTAGPDRERAGGRGRRDAG
jgi:hypothetical protein